MDALQASLINPDLEQSLLVAFAENPDLIWQWSDRLPTAVFADEECQALFKTQQTAASEGRSLPRPPGTPALVPDPDEAAKELLALYQKRQLTGLCQAVLHKMREAPDPGELLAALTGDLADLEAESSQLWGAGLTSARELLPSLWEDLDARSEAAEGTGLPGIPTGFTHLDNLTNGLEAGLYLLAGPPKAGKTTFVNQLAYQVAQAGLPVVYVSFENDPLDLLLKQLCRLSSQPLLRAQKGDVPRAGLEGAAVRLEQEVGDRLYYVAGGAETTVAKVRGKMKQALAHHGTPRGLLVLDYLQKMALVKPVGQQMRDNVNHLSLQLRDLSRETNSPLLAVASLSREGYAPGRKANVATLKESGNLEYDADAVWLLETEEDREGRGVIPVHLTIAAARRSPTGAVPLMLKQSCGRFTEQAHEGF